MNAIFQCSAGILALLGATASSRADGAADYLSRIKPVLAERCYACHGALKQKADLRVDTAGALQEAGVVVPGEPGRSELFLRVTSDDPDERMPPEGHALAPGQVAAIREWIVAGAPAPPGEKGEDDPRDHWSFQPVEKPEIPSIAGAPHPVDAFLAARREERGLTAQPVEAERSLLLRRLYLDLVGLPPTGEQLRDTRPWEEIVDELLASPHHGERWARHWMDVWRYSDWHGLGAQLRYSQKHLWHWRDWIVESLNEDKGYDRMILEMIAGDEIAPDDPATVRATGFLARNYFLFNRTTWLDTTIEHTGKAFLGLTLNCAKCHDHKYDPIGMEDYYSLRAIFEPHQVRLDPVPGEADFEKNGLPRVFDDHLAAVTRIHLRGDPKNPDPDVEIAPAIPEFLSSFAGKIEPVSLPVSAYAPGTRDYAQRDRLAHAEELIARAEEALRKARDASGAAATEASATGTGEEKKGTPDAVPGDFLIEDDFAKPDPDTWRIEGEGLEYRGGGLVQAVASRDPAKLVLRRPLPGGFEVTCRYTTTGGPTYRSVTFRFHLDEDGGNADFVYTSEHASGPKVQAAYSRAGKTSYPSDGRAGKTPAIGKEQELRFAVRDRLVNVWLDGDFLFAYRYPGGAAGTGFSLSAFDATAEFHSIRIRPLAPDTDLTEAKSGDAESAGDAERNLEIAEADLAAARAERDALAATVAADTARYRESAPDADLEKKAARLQVAAMGARAKADLLRHEGGDAKKRREAEALRKRGKEAAGKLAKGEFEYEPLRGSRKALETPAHEESDYAPVYPETSTGRRTMFAKWIASGKNPLTARVAVNHVWMRHFGEPLVESVFDFGRQARRPEQAELLDFLAAEFMESGWSFRRLHRLLVTSETYRRTSSNAGADPATRAADPGNRFYWRMNPRRMEAQVVRDSLLHLSGGLDLTVGGPSVDPGKGVKRRSLYFFHSPDKYDAFLAKFDNADLLQCYRRSESVVPQQALALANSAVSLEQAGKVAVAIEKGTGAEAKEKAFLEAAFLAVLARLPDASELAECGRFLDEISSLAAREGDKEAGARARSRLVHALLNHNDFITIR